MISNGSIHKDNVSESLNVDSFVQYVRDLKKYLIFGDIKTKNKLGVPVVIVGNLQSVRKKGYVQGCMSTFYDYYDNDRYDGLAEKYKDMWWNCCDDSDYRSKSKLDKIIEKINTERICLGGFRGFPSGGAFTPENVNLKLSIIFWNLFLCALDDDIYNEQLSRVVELAYRFHLNEDIIRDLCKGIEYLLSHRDMTIPFNFSCDTEECSKFFRLCV